MASVDSFDCGFFYKNPHGPPKCITIAFSLSTMPCGWAGNVRGQQMPSKSRPLRAVHLSSHNLTTLWRSPLKESTGTKNMYSNPRKLGEGEGVQLSGRMRSSERENRSIMPPRPRRISQAAAERGGSTSTGLKAFRATAKTGIWS